MFRSMNYKKLLLVAVAGASMVLAGCGNSAKDMTFQDTYNAFLDMHTKDALTMFGDFSSSPALSEKGNYLISASNASGLKANLVVNASSVVVNSGSNGDSTIELSGTVTEPTMDDTIALNTTILFKKANNKSYINLSNLSLKSQKGNPEISMVGAFSAMLTNKWISLAQSGVDTMSLESLNLSSIYSFPTRLITAMKTYPIFKETSKEMIDGKPVYHVALDQTGLYLVAKDLVTTDALKVFLGGQIPSDAELMAWAKTFVENAGFDGTLAAYSQKNTTLTINTMNLDQVSMLKGTIEEDKLHFDIMDSSDTTMTATVDVTEKGDATVFAVAMPQEAATLDGSIDLKKSNSDGV